MHWLGCIAINVRTEYSSTLLRKRNPRRRWSGRVGRCHSTQCRGLGTRPATRNHPRTYNTHATGNHPSSLIVGRARLPSGLKLTISLQPSPRKSHTALGDHPSALMGEMAMGTASPSGGGRSGAAGRAQAECSPRLRSGCSQCLSPRYWLTQETGGMSHRYWFTGGGRRSCSADCCRSHPCRQRLKAQQASLLLV